VSSTDPGFESRASRGVTSESTVDIFALSPGRRSRNEFKLGRAGSDHWRVETIGLSCMVELRRQASQTAQVLWTAAHPGGSREVKREDHLLEPCASTGMSRDMSVRHGLDSAQQAQP
jgi:hypothetical protein